MDIWDLHNLIKFLVLWVAQEHPRGGLAARKHSHELCKLTPGSQTGNDSRPSANSQMRAESQLVPRVYSLGLLNIPGT